MNSTFRTWIFLLPVLFLAVGCAYLNTYYNASVAFNKAHRAHQKLIQANADTAQTLPDEITKGYERTIVKCKKVVDDYPKDKKRHDDAMFLQAKATYYNRQYEAAILRLRSFTQEYASSPYVPDAYLLLGKAYLDNGELPNAEEIFNRILTDYPQLNRNEEVTTLIAQVSIKREGKSQAVVILEKSLATVRSDAKKREITLQLCNLYIELKMYDKAVVHLLSAPRGGAGIEVLYSLDYLLVICYRHLKSYDEAKIVLDRMMKNKRYGAHFAQIQFEEGLVYKETGEPAKAVKLFARLVESGATPAPLQGLAWFQLALIYQQSYGNFTKARECYEKAENLTTDEKIRKEAREKVRAIDLVTSYRDSIQQTGKHPDSTRGANHAIHYKLGEVYWLSLAEPDSALKLFSAIARDSTTDSMLVMKSLYAQAWIRRHVKDDQPGSDSLYRFIIRRYPASYVAQKSQQDIGVPVTVMTRADSAAAEFRVAEGEYFKNRDVVAAVNGYYRVAKKYPDIREVASESIYAAAWLCDNVLDKNQKAFELYTMLCDSFPESQLCIAVARPKIKLVQDTLKVLQIKDKTVQTKPKKGEAPQPISPEKSPQTVPGEGLLLDLNSTPPTDSQPAVQRPKP